MGRPPCWCVERCCDTGDDVAVDTVRTREVGQLGDPTLGEVDGAPFDHEVAGEALRYAERRVLRRVGEAEHEPPLDVGPEPMVHHLGKPAERPPHRFADVSWPLPRSQSGLELAEAPPAYDAPLPIGLELDSGDWAWLDAIEDGPVLPIAGPPKSGRSSALLAIAGFAADRGWDVITVVHSRRSPLAAAENDELGCRCSADELGIALDKTTGRVLVLVDDVQRLADQDLLQPAIDADGRALIAIAASADFLSSRTGVMRTLPAADGGLLLAPQGPLDGSAIGLRRLPDEWVANPRPGRGILAIAGEARQVQVPITDFRYDVA